MANLPTFNKYKALRQFAAPLLGKITNPMIEFENTAIVITARMAAQSLPGRPMVDISGRPLVLRAVDNAEKAGLGKVFVATPDNVVAEAARAGGADALMSPPQAKADADMAEAILALRDKAQLFQNVLIIPCQLAIIEDLALRLCLSALLNKGVDVATLACPIESAKARQILVEAPLQGEREVAYLRALTQTTEANAATPALLHLPIYAWSRASLQAFAAHKPSASESMPGLELVRALEAGQKCAVVKVDFAPLSVDTPQDLEALRRHWKA